MHEPSFAFLQQLLETPSASGSEQAIQEIVRRWARQYADEVRTDRHGNVIAARHPVQRTSATPRVMLAGHCDQIALMVMHIDSEGFLNIQPIGGWDMQILLGQYLTVCGRNGPITGVVSRRAPHLLTSEEKNKVPQFQDIWVDIGVKDKKEAEELVKIGDTVVFALGLRRLQNNFAASPGMDDKVGVWTVIEALRHLHGRPVQASIYAVSTVQEEIGLRGATTSSYGIDPHVGIAVDVTHATDTPGNDKKQIGEVKLGGGPVLYRGPNINPKVLAGLEAAATRLDIKVQMRGAPKATGTDANAIQLTRDGVATGLIGLPNRYMHSPVETVSLDDLDQAARMLAEFCTNVTPDADWTP